MNSNFDLSVKTREQLDENAYLIARYEVHSATNLWEAAWNIAVGQSVGNPNVRNRWETDELFENHSCRIFGTKGTLEEKNSGLIEIGFPVINTDWETDGMNHLLCQLMGGHVDIDVIKRCRLVGIEFPKHVKDTFLGPKFGISGMKEYVGVADKPFLGAIIKPKTGLSLDALLDMVSQLVDGGVNFIKEDEIMSNPACCSLEHRVDAIANLLARQSRKVVFCHTINCDPHILVDRVSLVNELGGNGVHINILGGLGAYSSIRKLDLPLFLHFQKSGDRLFTHPENKYSISWLVVCQLASMMGVDTIQTGMVGGYSSDDPEEVLGAVKILREGNTLPALSCGFHPGLLEKVNDLVGTEYLANVGGAIHGHPGGSRSGALAMRQAIDGINGPEYKVALKTWGKA